MKLQEDTLQPLATDGLVQEVLGRRFLVAQHPRLAAILVQEEVVVFPPDSTLPDPYDGLLDTHVGQALAVHDCMGVAIQIEGKTWGAITLDALKPYTFSQTARAELQALLPMLTLYLRTTLIEQNIRSLHVIHHTSMHSFNQVNQTEILGQSAIIQRVLQELDLVAESDLPVLITGETGVGKDLFAHRLHLRSKHSRKPLIQVNCAALPDSLAESELFGHVKGAFSGADTARPGRFEAADGGTLFLDEVGELSPNIQTKLLRALQNGEVQRLGEDKPRKVDVRIIAVTNRQLYESVRAGSFRSDLYYRLLVYPIHIPPLRERVQDILLLAGYFLELNRSRLGVRSLRLSQEAKQALLHYSWPGNIRELEHCISRSAIKALSHASSKEQIITIDAQQLDLIAGVTSQSKEIQSDVVIPEQTSFNTLNLQDVTQQVQRQLILSVLESTQYNWSASARLLQIDASNLHKLAKRLGIK